MKKSSLLIHCFYVLFPIAILMGIYCFLIGSGVSVLWNFKMNVPAEIPMNDQVIDPFEQLAHFTDSEISESVALYESTFSGISMRYGASVLVKSDEEMASEASSVTPVLLNARTGNSVENSEGSEESAPLPTPAAWNPSEADIWRVETSWASHCNPSEDQFRKLTFVHHTASGWEQLDADAFFADLDSSRPTIFYVHGNRTEPNTAMMQGLQVLKHFPCAVPARLVLWNWDAERVSRRPRIEYSTKANYADFQGFYLAEVLSKMAENSHVLLVGHSFGCRTILSSLHLLAGGTVGAKTLTQAFPEVTELTEISFRPQLEKGVVNARLGENVNDLQIETSLSEISVLEQNDQSEEKKLPKLDVMLVASAISCNALVPGAMYDQALNVVSEMHIIQNGADPALKLYPLMSSSRTRLPEAMGYVGPVLTNVTNENQAKIQVIRVEYQTHQFLEYISMRCVQNGLLFGENME